MTIHPNIPNLQAESYTIHAALAALHGGCDAVSAEQAGAFLVQSDGMELSIAARLQRSAIVLNHGFVRAEASIIARAADVYRRAGTSRFFLSMDFAPTQDALDRAGLVPARNWRNFRRAASTPLTAATKAAPIRKLGPGEAEDFARIVSDAFDLGPAAVPWMATIPKAPGWHVFQAEVDGRAAGTGALFVRDGYAWTDFGATSPAYRGKGIQKALLAHRIRFARSAGCHTILTCTGEAAPGDNQISYRNILKMGFEEANLMLNFAPA